MVLYVVNDKPSTKEGVADLESDENKVSSTPNLQTDPAAKNVEQVPRKRRLTEGSKGELGMSIRLLNILLMYIFYITVK